jgi:hypothetical protein
LLDFAAAHKIEYESYFRVNLGSQVAGDYKRTDRGDDIHAILLHSGMLSAKLDRFEEMSLKMRQLEWSLLKRDVADAAANVPPSSLPAAD